MSLHIGRTYILGRESVVFYFGKHLGKMEDSCLEQLTKVKVNYLLLGIFLCFLVC